MMNDISESGITFFTDVRSRKVQEVMINNHVCALTYWPELARQVRIEGAVETIDDQFAELEFQSKTYEQQLAITLCAQSEPLRKHWLLKRQYSDILANHANRPKIVRPEYWRGFLLKPKSFEFFKGEDGRINKRIRFLRIDGSKWRSIHLFP